MAAIATRKWRDTAVYNGCSSHHKHGRRTGDTYGRQGNDDRIAKSAGYDLRRHAQHISGYSCADRGCRRIAGQCCRIPYLLGAAALWVHKAARRHILYALCANKNSMVASRIDRCYNFIIVRIVYVDTCVVYSQNSAC